MFDPTSGVKGVAQPGAKVLLVASSGGHLSELVRLAARWELSDESVWVTFRTIQSEQLLAGRRVEYLPYIGPRDWRGTVASAPMFRALLGAERFDAVVSTGAAVATAALGVARARGVPATYIESLGRLDRPSRTGRILEWMPGIDLRTQHDSGVRGRWMRHRSVLDDFRSVSSEPRGRRLFVTLGTIRPYRFDALIDAVLSTGLADEDTVWQLGSTTRTDLPGTAVDILPPAEFDATLADADVVISHAGVGTLLEMLPLGVYPVMAIRRASRREHVDDHQEQIAELVRRRDLGCAVDVEDLDSEVIARAAERRIVDVASPRLAPSRTDQ